MTSPAYEYSNIRFLALCSSVICAGALSLDSILDEKFLVRNIIPNVSLLSVLVVLTFSKPRSFCADFLWFQDETFGAQYVEENPPDKVGGCGARHLQARTEPFVAGAVHHTRDAPVEESVARLKRRNVKRTGSVVFSAAGIRNAESAQIRVLGRSMTASTPLRSRYH